jgi:putative ABC transport system permease protein
VNLTLARSLNRAREVGIRKVAGARRSQLMGQFLAESVLVAFLALGLSYFILNLLELLPSVQRWLTRDIKQDWVLWAFFIGLYLLTGLVAGWVPARVLSAYQPVQVLKGAFGTPAFPGNGPAEGADRGAVCRVAVFHGIRGRLLPAVFVHGHCRLRL